MSRRTYDAEVERRDRAGWRVRFDGCRLKRIVHVILIGFVFGFAGSGTDRVRAQEADSADARAKPVDVVRITCVKHGIHRVRGDQLAKLGIRLRAIEHDQIALVHHDESVPFHAVGLDDGVFNRGDSIYFFAEGPKTEELPYINTRRPYYPVSQSFTLHLGPSRHQPDLFIHKSTGPRAIDDPDAYPLYLAEGRRRFEKDPIWEFVRDGAMKDPEVDYLFWEKMTYPKSNETEQTVTIPFVLPDLDVESTASAEIRLMGISAVGGLTQSMEHHLTTDFNGKCRRYYEWSQPAKFTAHVEIPPRKLRKGKNEFKATLHPPKVFKLTTTGLARKLKIDVVALDWFEVRFKQFTNVHEGYNEFYFSEEDLKEPISLSIRNFSSGGILVFDVENKEVFQPKPFREKGSKNYGVNLRLEPGEKTLVATTFAAALDPFEMKRVRLRNLFAQPVDCDMLILTHGQFRSALKPFIDWKVSRGLKVHMVDIDDIFNEESAGFATVESMRDYVEYVYNSQPEPKLKYLLLVGDSSLISKYMTHMPAYSFHQSGFPPNDNYFANFVDPFDAPVLAVGRFSVREAEQIQDITRKIIDYESGKDNGAWRSRFFVIAAAAAWATRDADKLIDRFVRPHFASSLLRTENHKSSPEYHAFLTQQIVDQLNTGNLITAFFGHGGGTVWEVGPAMAGGYFRTHLFDQKNVAKLENRDRLPLVFALTCYTNKFDDPHVTQTLGETFMNSPGGAISVIGATGRSSTSLNYIYMEAFMEALKERRFNRLGDYMVAAKEKYKRASTYLLIGDPSLEFNLPEPTLAITNVQYDDVDGRLTFDYELPEDIELPAPLNLIVLDKDEKLVDEWTHSVDAPQGSLERPLNKPYGASTLRLAGYLTGGPGQWYAGGATIEISTEQKQVSLSREPTEEPERRQTQ